MWGIDTGVSSGGVIVGVLVGRHSIDRNWSVVACRIQKAGGFDRHRVVFVAHRHHRARSRNILSVIVAILRRQEEEPMHVDHKLFRHWHYRSYSMWHDD